jgi:thiol-disulfide isomerase/thioredoxin
MQRGTRAASAVAIALVALTATARADEAGPSRLVEKLGAAELGRLLPSFAGWTPEGEVVTLARALRPRARPPVRALVVSFFATWCEPCRDRLPAVATTVAGRKDADVLLVHVGEPGEDVRGWLRPLGLRDATVILDPYQKIAGRLGIGTTLPRTLVLDGGGLVVGVFEHEGGDFADALGRLVVEAGSARPGAGVAATSAAR